MSDPAPRSPRPPRRKRARPELSSSWEVSGVRAAYPALQMLGPLLPRATSIVAVGSARAWFGLAGPLEAADGPTESDDAERRSPLAVHDTGLPFTPGTLSRLHLAARLDGETAFCRELLVYRRSVLLLRWITPVGGPIHIAAEVPEHAVFRFSTLSAGTYRRRSGAL